jgi:hypothetical protein
LEHWIEQVPEPRKLFLAWQAPDHMGDRFRWAVGILVPRDGECTLRYFQPGAEFERHNQGYPFTRLLELGYQGYPGFKPRQAVHEDGVLAALMRRLPPRSRPDFSDYKRLFRLPRSLDLSNFALLGQTEAKLPNDGFSVVDPLDPEIVACELLSEIAGLRYYLKDSTLALEIGDPIELLPEPENPKDPNAVKVYVGSARIGYVNRLQAGTFLQWLKYRQVTGVIERLSGTIERPRAFIFIRVRPIHGRVAA